MTNFVVHRFEAVEVEQRQTAILFPSRNAEKLYQALGERPAVHQARQRVRVGELLPARLSFTCIALYPPQAYDGREHLTGEHNLACRCVSRQQHSRRAVRIEMRI